MNTLTLILAMICIMFVNALGAFYFKKASKKFNIKLLLKNYNFFIAGFLFIISTISYTYLLRNYNLSLLYPMTSLSYIWTAFLGCWLLKEKITINKTAGIILIVIGVIILNL